MLIVLLIFLKVKSMNCKTHLHSLSYLKRYLYMHVKRWWWSNRTSFKIWILPLQKLYQLIFNNQHSIQCMLLFLCCILFIWTEKYVFVDKYNALNRFDNHQCRVCDLNCVQFSSLIKIFWLFVLTIFNRGLE